MIHLTRITHIMPEELLHDVLGDAGVDEPGAERVAELVAR